MRSLVSHADLLKLIGENSGNGNEAQTGEKNLFIAIVRLAITDALTLAKSNRKHKKTAQNWILYRGYTHKRGGITFDYICEALNWPANDIRRKVIEHAKAGTEIEIYDHCNRYAQSRKNKHKKL
jgi:hypothetical protein